MYHDDDALDRDEVLAVLRELRVAQRPEAARRLVRWLDAITYESADPASELAYARGLVAALELPPDPVPPERVLTITRGGTIVSTGGAPGRDLRRLLLEEFGEAGQLPSWVEEALASRAARPAHPSRFGGDCRAQLLDGGPVEPGSRGLIELDFDGVPTLLIGVVEELYARGARVRGVLL